MECVGLGSRVCSPLHLQNVKMDIYIFSVVLFADWCLPFIAFSLEIRTNKKGWNCFNINFHKTYDQRKAWSLINSNLPEHSFTAFIRQPGRPHNLPHLSLTSEAVVKNEMEMNERTNPGKIFLSEFVKLWLRLLNDLSLLMQLVNYAKDSQRFKFQYIFRRTLLF